MIQGTEDKDTQILLLQEKLEEFNDMKDKLDDIEKLNKQLFTKNQEYFLKITNTSNNTNNIPEINEYEEYVGDDFYKALSTKEKELLEIILEGED